MLEQQYTIPPHSPVIHSRSFYSFFVILPLSTVPFTPFPPTHSLLTQSWSPGYHEAISFPRCLGSFWRPQYCVLQAQEDTCLPACPPSLLPPFLPPFSRFTYWFLRFPSSPLPHPSLPHKFQSSLSFTYCLLAILFASLTRLFSSFTCWNFYFLSSSSIPCFYSLTFLLLLFSLTDYVAFALSLPVFLPLS